MANRKRQKGRSPFENTVSDSGKMVKKQKKDRGILPKSQLPPFIDEFNRKILLELGMKERDITECLTLPKKEIIIRILKKTSKEFNKIKHLFEDIPQNSFSGARKDLNDWTLREVFLLVSSMEMNQMKKPKDWNKGIPWESIDPPRDGAEETWKSITNRVPNTMEEVFKRVKTISVWRLLRPAKFHLLPPNAFWNKKTTMYTQVRREIDNVAIRPVNLHANNVLEVMSPFGRMIIHVRAMEEIVRGGMEFTDKVEKRNIYWGFPSV